MTGHGEARLEEGGVAVVVETRSINNRYFKCVVRAGDGYMTLESLVEELARTLVRRGTVQVNLRVDRPVAAEEYQINAAALLAYHRQLERLCDQTHAATTIPLVGLLGLPGVAREPAPPADVAERVWSVVEKTVVLAFERLNRMRLDEGRAMEADMRANLGLLQTELDAVRARAPAVVEAYRLRLRERINAYLQECNAQPVSGDFPREIGLFAEKSDISEEVVRLGSHLRQFHELLADAESQGRKLDFLTQEMFRETNTIGSKANDGEVSRRVVEMKAAIERLREMVQNVE